MDLSTFTCPNRPNFVLSQNNESRWRIGFYAQVGRDTEAAFNGPRNWISPLTPDDDSQLVAFSDVNESGTQNPPLANYSHGKSGLVEGPGRHTTPTDANAQGGNVGRNDGSVAFIPTQELFGFTVVKTNATYVGFWPNVNTYDNDESVLVN